MVFLKQTGKSTKANGSGSHINYLLKNAEYNKSGILFENAEMEKDFALKYAKHFDKLVRDNSQYSNIHFLVALPKGIEMSQAKSLVNEFKNKHYKDATMMMCVHLKEGNPHCHIVLWKNERYTNRDYDKKPFIYTMRDNWGQYCEEQGLKFSFDLSKQRNKSRVELQLKAKGKSSWVDTIDKEFNNTLQIAKDYKEFKEIFKSKNITILNEDTNSVSFNLQGINRNIRLRRISNNKYKNVADIQKAIAERIKSRVALVSRIAFKHNNTFTMSQAEFENWKEQNKNIKDFDSIVKIIEKQRKLPKNKKVIDDKESQIKIEQKQRESEILNRVRELLEEQTENLISDDREQIKLTMKNLGVKVRELLEKESKEIQIEIEKFLREELGKIGTERKQQQKSKTRGFDEEERG
jgi:hypothetical protein